MNYSYRLMLVILSMLLACSPLPINAQTDTDTKEIKTLLKELYELNSYELQCYSLKAGVNRAKLKSIIQRYRGNNFFARKMSAIFDWRAKSGSHWQDFYSSFYTQDIVSKIAPLCDPRNPQSNSMYMKDDLRFPSYLSELNDASQLVVDQLLFRDLKIEKDGLVQYVEIHVKDEPPFLIRYVFHQENGVWRIWDMAESHYDTDRRNVLEVSFREMLSKK